MIAEDIRDGEKDKAESEDRECIKCEFFGMGCYTYSYCDEYEPQESEG